MVKLKNKLDCSEVCLHYRVGWTGAGDEGGGKEENVVVAHKAVLGLVQSISHKSKLLGLLSSRR